MRWFRGAVGAMVLVAVACVGEEAPIVQGPSSDAGATDAGGSSGSSGSSGADGSTTGAALFNDDFEVSCGSWRTFQTSAAIAPPGHGGQSGCKVCVTDASGGQIERYVDLPAPTSGQLRFQVYARLAEGATEATSLPAYVQSYDGDTLLEENAGDFSVGATYAAHEIGLTMTKPANKVRVNIELKKAGLCVLLDDTVLTHTP